MNHRAFRHSSKPWITKGGRYLQYIEDIVFLVRGSNKAVRDIQDKFAETPSPLSCDINGIDYVDAKGIKHHLNPEDVLFDESGEDDCISVVKPNTVGNITHYNPNKARPSSCSIEGPACKDW